jgi:hypothetical protein
MLMSIGDPQLFHRQLVTIVTVLVIDCGISMQAGPIEDFFAPVVARESPASTTEPEEQAKMLSLYNQQNISGNQLVAQILCRNYHFMIATGIEYAYIATGNHVMFLRVPKDDWRTLLLPLVRLFGALLS